LGTTSSITLLQNGVDYPARDVIKQLQDADFLQTVTSVDVQENSADLITDMIQRDMRYREFPDMCKALGGGCLTLLLAKVPQNLLTDQTMRYLMGDFTRRAAREAGDYREYPGDEPDSIVFINSDGVRAEPKTLHISLYRKTRSRVASC
jgi:hypothetical protein